MERRDFLVGLTTVGLGASVALGDDPEPKGALKPVWLDKVPQPGMTLEQFLKALKKHPTFAEDFKAAMKAGDEAKRRGGIGPDFGQAFRSTLLRRLGGEEVLDDDVEASS